MTAAGANSGVLVVMGLPRSGTTWLGKIFDSHPDTFYSHEPDSASPFRDVPLIVPVTGFEEYRERILRDAERFRRARTTRVVGKFPLFEKSHSIVPLWLRAQELVFAKGLARFLGDLEVPRHACGDPEKASRWVWKSIESSGRLGAVARILPAAKLIFIIRHPCGVAASILRGEAAMKFSAGPSSEDLGFFALLAETELARSRGLTVGKFATMSAVKRVAWRWALLNAKALADIAGLSNCKVVRYEDLCERPADVSRSLFEFAELDWNAQTEGFITQSTARERPSYYGVFKDPRQSANKWREQLSAATVEEILEVVGETEPGMLYLPETTASAGG